ncbi:hypothetical protein IWZ03DRAFT_403157 [Phyllosticta citriasiana]|uniref:Uncharacterized protein n=1 Tax=Phyllosticta citriasiana TaxID=595635 RepID=A0ABR1KZ12_9PEZI
MPPADDGVRRKQQRRHVSTLPTATRGELKDMILRQTNVPTLQSMRLRTSTSSARHLHHPGDKCDDHRDDHRDDHSLARLCCTPANALESLRLDSGLDSCCADDFLHQDSLLPFHGLALSPRVSEVHLSRLIASADAVGRNRRVPLWWDPDDPDDDVVALVFPQSDKSWEKLLVRLRVVLLSFFPSSSSSSKKPPSSSISLHMRRRLIDSVGVTSDRYGSGSDGRILLDTYSNDDDAQGSGSGWFVRTPPLQRQHAQPQQLQQPCCPLCEQTRRSSSLDSRGLMLADERIGVDSGLDDVRRVLGLRWGAGLSDDGVVFDLW